MSTYLSDSWKIIKDEAPSKESVGKTALGLGGIYTTFLIYHHRKPIWNWITTTCNEGYCLLTKKNNNCNKNCQTDETNETNETNETDE